MDKVAPGSISLTSNAEIKSLGYAWSAFCPNSYMKSQSLPGNLSQTHLDKTDDRPPEAYWQIIRE